MQGLSNNMNFLLVCLDDTSTMLFTLSSGWFASSLKLRFITYNEVGGDLVSNALEVCIVFIKRTNGHAA